MTLDEAIKYLNYFNKNTQGRFSQELHDAIKLGEEALKWVKRYRPDNKIDRWSLLPGETK